ncbi:MAG: hypothetical protein RL389_917 [Actinomycetota bacterium]|jgi:uncharacterized protein (TIGR00645 family)
MAKVISTKLENLLFWSRWLLSPLYLGLVVVLVLVIVRFGQDFYKLLMNMAGGDTHAFTIDLLALLDLVLLANLILIVIFAGYENFVSRIDAAHESVDRPHWMGTIDFSGLKIKLIGSLVAISVIELLKDFIHLGEEPDAKVGEGVIWRIVIHLTFVVSGVLFAVMDVIGDRHKSEAKDLKKDGTLKGKPGAKR